MVKRSSDSSILVIFQLDGWGIRLVVWSNITSVLSVYRENVVCRLLQSASRLCLEMLLSVRWSSHWKLGRSQFQGKVAKSFWKLLYTCNPYMCYFSNVWKLARIGILNASSALLRSVTRNCWLSRPTWSHNSPSGHICLFVASTDKVKGQISVASTDKVKGHIFVASTDKIKGHIFVASTDKVKGHIFVASTDKIKGHILVASTDTVKGHILVASTD